MNQAIVDCLKNGRKNVGMTQKEVAEKMGVRQSVYSQWETGRYEPDIDTLLELLRIYNLDYKEVFPNIQKAENEHRFFLSDAEEEIILSIRSLPDTMRNTIVDLIREIVEIFDVAGIDTEIIAASVRNPIHVTDCALAGADIATVPYNVIVQMTKHPLTDAGIAKFQADYKAVFGE